MQLYWAAGQVSVIQVPKATQDVRVLSRVTLVPLRYHLNSFQYEAWGQDIQSLLLCQFCWLQFCWYIVLSADFSSGKWFCTYIMAIQIVQPCVTMYQNVAWIRFRLHGLTLSIFLLVTWAMSQYFVILATCNFYQMISPTAFFFTLNILIHLYTLYHSWSSTIEWDAYSIELFDTSWPLQLFVPQVILDLPRLPTLELPGLSLCFKIFKSWQSS